ncbi:MAG TPA: kelch repeat-containing protein [Chthoniobacterales bacterium]|nr:kelch repeat-containing protein [Chthoniobacterales bacterium]
MNASLTQKIPTEKSPLSLAFHRVGAFRRYWPGAQKQIASVVAFFGAGLVFAHPCAGGSGVFEQTGSLAIPRSNHTATLLPNGKVLAAGTGGGDFSAELYDSASGTWTTTGGLGVQCWNFTATLLPNGKVLAAGGLTVREEDMVVGFAGSELYDPASGGWTSTGSLNVARSQHTATLLPNGKVLVAGGYDSGVQIVNAELYDPISGTWTITGNPGAARSSATATLLTDGKVLVAGGYSGGPLASAEIYDPATGVWASTGSLANARYDATATLLPGGQVLVAGGYGGGSTLASAELYNPVAGTWTTTASLSTAREKSRATLLPNGKVLVVGGMRSGPDGAFLPTAELYDPVQGTWTATGSLSTGRVNHTATLLPNGEVLVAAGYMGFGGSTSSAELYGGPPTPPAMLNISTRMRVLTDDKVLIGGFIITGTELKRILIRGIGPSLNGAGVTLSDPTLELHQGSTTLATNDNWKFRSGASSQQEDIESTTIPPTNDSESAILMALSPGAYTVILAGQHGETGVGLVEVYDLGQGANSQLANISTRGFVDTGDNVMIGGLIVGGGSGVGTARMLVRALGPSVPVAGALGDPTLELRDGSGTLVASNDNWKTRPDGSSQQEEIEATTIPPTNDFESALVQDLPAGNYTAIVRGMDNTAGIGLVEAYNLQ